MEDGGGGCESVSRRSGRSPGSSTSSKTDGNRFNGPHRIQIVKVDPFGRVIVEGQGTGIGDVEGDQGESMEDEREETNRREIGRRSAE